MDVSRTGSERHLACRHGGCAMTAAPCSEGAVVQAIRISMPVVLVTRLVIFFVGYLAVLVVGYPGGQPPVRDFAGELSNLPSRFDARWYLQIARDGYSFDPAAGPGVQQNVVFFPAFPMAIRAVAGITGSRPASFFIAGTSISLMAFLAALAYVYLLAREHLTSSQSAIALWLLAVYPFAFFYGAIYTESLFLLETAATFYHFRRRQFAIAGAWGLLAGLTRPNGCLIAAPLALVAVFDWLRMRREGAGHGPETVQIRAAAWPLLALCAVAAPVAGMLVYTSWMWRSTGNPWSWAAGQAAWGHRYHGVGGLLAARYGLIMKTGVSGYLAALPHDFLNGLALFLVLATAWPVGRRLGLAYALWMVINTVPSLTTLNLISAGRYTSVLFPMFIWMAGAIPDRYRAGWIGSFAALQAVGAAMFYTWRPLY